ncbi:MAG TPA: HlyD family efflux transporter periplasmic adaptor subunit [Bauldia sp.]|nr:HlyD family efflux transporter periplasmic adaptor subunit [Bauldia sp.]
MNARFLVALLPLALGGCNSSEAPLQGYVDGTYVYVAAEAGGRVTARPAMAGTRVKAGDVLFTLDEADQKEQVAGAEARLAQAQAQLANLQTGARPEEIAVLASTLSAARTAQTQADDDYTRKLTLLTKGVVAQSVVDDAKAKRDSAEAQADAAERQLLVAKLPARQEEIDAAEKNVAAMQADLAQAHTAFDRRQIKAPADGLIEETYFEPGELVAAGQAVVSLLPDTNRKVRFFVPERMLSSVAPGKTVNVGCDGCAAGMSAEVTFVATEAEFTPPIIYSKESRDKLVFRVDAKPVGDAATLKVGQPLDIRLAP